MFTQEKMSLDDGIISHFCYLPTHFFTFQFYKMNIYNQKNVYIIEFKILSMWQGKIKIFKLIFLKINLWKKKTN